MDQMKDERDKYRRTGGKAKMEVGWQFDDLRQMIVDGPGR